MDNPFKPGDKVLIMRNGVEINAVVRTTYNHEVQVRIADGELLWRTVKTTRSLIEPPAVSESAEPHEEVPVVADEGIVLETTVKSAPEASLAAENTTKEPSQRSSNGRKDKRRNLHSRKR